MSELNSVHQNSNAADPASSSSASLSRAGKTDASVSAITGFALYASMLYVAIYYEDGRHLYTCILAGAAGTALGWVIGIVVSPYSTSEQHSFASIGKIVYGFLSGYALSKFDPVITTLIRNPADHNPTTLLTVPAFVAFTSFLTAAAWTYVNRSYWLGRFK